MEMVGASLATAHTSCHRKRKKLRVLAFYVPKTSWPFCVTHLSTKAWWRINMGSFAEPCTDDMDPFMNTWREACIPKRGLLPNPVCGSPNPAKWRTAQQIRWKNRSIMKWCADSQVRIFYLIFHWFDSSFTSNSKNVSQQLS